MKKDELISVFYSNHQTFLDYFNGLSMDELNYRYADKWTAIEQLERHNVMFKTINQSVAIERIHSAKFWKP